MSARGGESVDTFRGTMREDLTTFRAKLTLDIARKNQNGVQRLQV